MTAADRDELVEVLAGHEYDRHHPSRLRVWDDEVEAIRAIYLRSARRSAAVVREWLAGEVEAERAASESERHETDGAVRGAYRDGHADALRLFRTRLSLPDPKENR